MSCFSRFSLLTIFCAFSLFLAGCATETSQTVAPQQVTAAKTSYSGPRSTVAVGKFDNRSSFMRGLFSDGVDRLGGQAKTILITHMQQANRFKVVDRDNMGEISQEAKFKGKTQKISGADFVITGDVTEFGRKEVGDQQLFGILGRGKTQIAYSKVSLNVVDAVGCLVHSSKNSFCMSVTVTCVFTYTRALITSPSVVTKSISFLL